MCPAIPQSVFRLERWLGAVMGVPDWNEVWCHLVFQSGVFSALVCPSVWQKENCFVIQMIDMHLIFCLWTGRHCSVLLHFQSISK